MASNRTIRCTNEDGFYIDFAESGFGPFLLKEAEGLYDVKNTVYMSENSMIDGATYQGSVAKFRNIILHLTDTENYLENRDMLNRLFKEKARGTLVYQEADTDPRKIEYVVESLTSTGEDPYREHEISLICPDPFFYDIEVHSESMASWHDAFEFPFEPTSTGFEFGHRINERIKTITNDYAEDGMGMTITITCSGSVTNPSVTRIESNESLEIGHSGKPFNMIYGDVVTITTAAGNKHVTLTRDGVTTEINHYLTEDSVFIQLMRGQNSIGFAADSGENNVTVEVGYQFKYART